MNHADVDWSQWRRLAPFVDLEVELTGAGTSDPVLDLGCGNGFWLPRIATAGLRPVGIEPDPARAGVAGRLAPVAVGEGAWLPLGDSTVGTVWCLHVLHHLEDPAAVLTEIARVLRPGGRLLLAESVEDNPAIRMARTLWPSWEGVPVRARFSAAELAAMVGDAGLQIVEYRHHSPLSFVGLVPPRGGRPLWSSLRWLERRYGRRLDRWGAYVDCVALAPPAA
ncbi:MAG: class I SAM-dependent methyltransferase [Acidimicrobiales bacterium]